MYILTDPERERKHNDVTDIFKCTWGYVKYVIEIPDVVHMKNTSSIFSSACLYNKCTYFI